jgi:hypothetical protein
VGIRRSLKAGEGMRLYNVLDLKALDDGCQIEMAYIPNISKNRYKTRDGFIKRDVQTWMEQLAFCVGVFRARFEAPLKVVIECSVEGTGRLPDTQNFIDVISDAVEEGTGINDKDYTIETTPAKRGDSKVILKVTSHEEKPVKAEG